MSAIFLKTVFEKEGGGKYRVRILSNQRDPKKGGIYDPTKNVNCGRDVREKYPVGTIFACDSVELVAAGIYKATPNIIRAVADDKGNMLPEARREEYEQYKRLMEVILSGEVDYGEKMLDEIPESADELIDLPNKKPRHIPTFLDKLRTDYPVPTVEEHGFYVSEDNWYYAVRNALRAENTLLIGPTGTGKTAFCMLVARLIKRAFHIHDMGTMQDAQAALLGVHRLTSDGASKFDYSKFTVDITKPAFMLLDEISRAPLAANNILLGCLDDRRELLVDVADSEHARAIPVHEECCFFATANIGGEYTGTLALDAALTNRFSPLEMEYLSAALERDVLMKRCGIGVKDATIISEIATKLRGFAKAEEIGRSVSHRETLKMAALVKDGYPVLKAMKMLLMPLFEGTETDGDKATVLTTLQRH